MNTIVLQKDDIINLKELFNICPDNFNYVPLKLFKDENNDSFASIETIDINGDTLFSGKISISDLEFEPNNGMVIRLPINKSIINNVFNPEFTSISLNKNKIVSKSDNMKLTISLLQINESDIVEFPYTNIELYELSKEQNNITDSNSIIFDLDSDKTKQFMDYINLLSDIEKLEFCNISNNLAIKGEDYTGNKLEFNFGVPIDFKPDFSYDMNFIKILNKIIKYKDADINVLVSDLLIAITVKKDSMISTLAVTAQR